MENLMEILLDRMLNGDKKDKAPKKTRGRPKKEKVSIEDVLKAEEALQLKAKEEVRKRAQKRLDEAMKKQADEVNILRSKQKRMFRNEQRLIEEKEREDAQIASIIAPTKRLQWDLVDGNIQHLRAFLNGRHIFDIKRGILTYKLYLSDLKVEKGVSFAQRAKDVQMGNNFSGLNVYDLKTKAENVLKRIEELEKRKKG
jgi:hypothetical protein